MTNPIRAMSANAIADDMVHHLRTTEREIIEIFRRNDLTWPGVVGAGKLAQNFIDSGVRAALEGRPREVGPHEIQALRRLPADAQRELFFAAHDAAIRRMWQKGRVAYDVDPDTWNELGEAEPNSRIPVEVLERLPHTNPLIVFPEAIVLDSGERERQRVVGAFICGVASHHKVDLEPIGTGTEKAQVLCSTDDPDVRGWSFTFCGLIETADGRPVYLPQGPRDVMWTRTSVLIDKESTLADLTQQSLERFNAYTGPAAFGDHRQDVPKLLARTVNLLVYIGAVNADLKPLPSRPSQTRQKGKNGGGKPAKVIGVGFRVGAKLRAWRRNPPRARTDGATGRTVAPHIRRSHPHTFRYGPGRRNSYVKWMWPIEVNMDAGDKKTTIISVP